MPTHEERLSALEARFEQYQKDLDYRLNAMNALQSRLSEYVKADVYYTAHDSLRREIGDNKAGVERLSNEQASIRGRQTGITVALVALLPIIVALGSALIVSFR